MSTRLLHPMEIRSPRTPSCAGTNTDDWFPENGVTPKILKRICASCPFQEPCLEWALHHEEYGVWAGTGPIDRKKMRKERGIELVAPHVIIFPTLYDGNVIEHTEAQDER